MAKIAIFLFLCFLYVKINNMETNETKPELKAFELIKNSDTFNMSKKFLYQKLKEYYNNDKNLDSNEFKKIKKLIESYDNIETKYENYKKFITKQIWNKLNKEQQDLLISSKRFLEEMDTERIINKWINKTINSYMQDNYEKIKVLWETSNNITELLSEVKNKQKSYISTKNNEFIKKINTLKKTVPLIKKTQEKYEKYTEKLNEVWLSNETQKIIIKWIYEKLKNKTVVIDWKKIKLTSKYIERNKKKFIKNITKFLVILMNIESYGWKNIENKKSSAKWPLQWIDWWKNWKKHYSFNRKEWKTSPFETALRRASMFYTWDKYPKFESDLIPKDIIAAWNNWWKLEIKSFNTEKQIQLWYIDLLMRRWKAKDYLMWTMLWNKWSAIKLYTNIHHTNSWKWTKTSSVVKNNFKYLALI